MLATSSQATAAESSRAAARRTAGGGRSFVLVSCDGRSFTLSEAAASLSRVIRVMIEEPQIHRGDNRVRFPSVSGKTLAMIAEYCKRHDASAASGGGGSSSSGATEAERLKAFDKEFIGDVGPDLLYDVLTAANFLEIEELIDLGCKRVGELMKGKTPQQIRELFKIDNDFTQEEEDKIREENPWLFIN
ncbi:hypothetical protein ABZP36_036018 [Zizania latifolia]